MAIHYLPVGTVPGEKKFFKKNKIKFGGMKKVLYICTNKTQHNEKV